MKTDWAGMMPSENQQRDRLFALKDRKGYGILVIIRCRGDVVVAASPVPELVGYEIVAASPECVYDIWKDGNLATPNQTKEQIQDWIHKHTPEWLYDDSTPTKQQKRLVQSWTRDFMRRYPGSLELG